MKVEILKEREKVEIETYRDRSERESRIEKREKKSLNRLEREYLTMNRGRGRTVRERERVMTETKRMSAIVKRVLWF